MNRPRKIIAGETSPPWAPSYRLLPSMSDRRLWGDEKRGGSQVVSSDQGPSQAKDLLERTRRSWPNACHSDGRPRISKASATALSRLDIV